jgi:hypothetical protein
MTWNRLSQFRWGEAVAFLTMLIVGFVIFLIQLWTWAIPQLTLHQEFVPSRGIIAETRVAETITDTGKQYRPEVLLEHLVDGKRYRVWTFDFPTLRPKEGFLPDQSQAQIALQPFAAGRRVECWYRINHPEQAIVVWHVSVWGWFLLLLSFSLIVLGFIGFLQSFHLLAVSRERRAAALALPSPLQTGSAPPPIWATVPDIRGINESPGTQLSYRLPLGSRPIFPLVGMIIFAAAWNIVAVVVLVHSFFFPERDVSDQVFGVLFRSLFCAGGLLLLWWVAHRFWIALRLAPMLLELSDHPIYPGRKYRLLLRQAGSLQFLKLETALVCEEIARFHQGTDTATSRKDVFRQILFSRSDFSTTPDLPLNEEFFLQLPLGAMHSFRQDNNEIVWKLEITSQFPGWQELCRDCPVVVRPVTVNDSLLEGTGL